MVRFAETTHRLDTPCVVPSTPDHYSIKRFSRHCGPVSEVMVHRLFSQGAGASSAKKDLGTCDKSGKKLASSEFIGPEFDVKMVSPKIPGLEAGTPYRLRIAYEALVVVEPTEGAAPLCHFKYQDILCWGHGKHTFQFKVFGNLFGQDRSEYVTIRFETSHGKVRDRRRRGAPRPSALRGFLVRGYEAARELSANRTRAHRRSRR